MNESILKALMRLFAIIANVDESGVSKKALQIVEAYLLLMLNRKNVDEYLALFDNYVKIHHKVKDKDSLKAKKRTSVNSVKVLMICNEINEQLHQEEKIIVLVRLLEFISEDNVISDEELDFVKTVAEVFNISQAEYNSIRSFVFAGTDFPASESSHILLINSSKQAPNSEIKHIRSKNMEGEIGILYIESTGTFIMKYIGDSTIFLNSQNIKPRRIYVFDTGSVIKSPKIAPIYQSDAVSAFISSEHKEKVIFRADNIAYTYPGSTNGIKAFSFEAKSGNLIGIMGGSGVGKSTLLNLLNGNLKPDEGKITINGYNIHGNKADTEGILGFVPQDDLLIEELTVYQNLYFNAKLCFSKFNESQIKERVLKILDDLELLTVKDLTVGSPLKKFISGGQRKRLNIALELMREPTILIVDEPTSGLSSMDSETVMSLLKEQSLQGKVVLVNIHQPSSEIYKLFDNLLILDQGGYPVYQGNPVNALTYFKKKANFVNAEDNECITCGNVDAELPLQILEARQVDQFGKFTKERKISPKEWYIYYRSNIQQAKLSISEKPQKKTLPKNNFNIPGKFEQFKIFSVRNILAKLTDKQYLLITFTEAPLLAVILGYFSKYISGTDDDPTKYIFAENMNLPAFLFMAVTVALFIGLTVSAEEIIKDRKILKREKFLNLSKFAYLNSKIFVLFIISAIQTLSFVVIGNLILEIKGMTFSYWLILFSASAFANLLGLNISASLKSVVTIYITIPFILVPQLLFSGVIVDFTKLHRSFTSYNHVPVIGDLMTSRWAYEALTVEHYRNNEYQKHFFENDKKKSVFTYQISYLIPKLQELLNEIKKTPEKNNSNNYALLRNGFSKLYTNRIQDEDFWEEIRENKLSRTGISSALLFLKDETKLYNGALRKLRNGSNQIFNELIKQYGSKEAVYKLKKDYHNKQLEDLLQNKDEISAYKIDHNRIIQLKDPIYKDPVSNNGRAHFYAPHKQIGDVKINTPTFNIIFMWFTSAILYVFLIFNVFGKLISSFNKEEDTV
jgi:ABC-type multidrug transport system ATPase subunit